MPILSEVIAYAPTRVSETASNPSTTTLNTSKYYPSPETTSYYTIFVKGHSFYIVLCILLVSGLIGWLFRFFSYYIFAFTAAKLSSKLVCINEDSMARLSKDLESDRINFFFLDFQSFSDFGTTIILLSI